MGEVRRDAINPLRVYVERGGPLAREAADTVRALKSRYGDAEAVLGEDHFTVYEVPEGALFSALRKRRGAYRIIEEDLAQQRSGRLQFLQDEYARLTGEHDDLSRRLQQLSGRERRLKRRIRRATGAGTPDSYADWRRELLDRFPAYPEELANLLFSRRRHRERDLLRLFHTSSVEALEDVLVDACAPIGADRYGIWLETSSVFQTMLLYDRFHPGKGFA